MSDIGRYKLSDAIPAPKIKGDEQRSGMPLPTHETTVEQACEAEENAKAHDGEASIRERMVDIGRGDQQAGRQGQ